MFKLFYRDPKKNPVIVKRTVSAPKNFVQTETSHLFANYNSEQQACSVKSAIAIFKNKIIENYPNVNYYKQFDQVKSLYAQLTLEDKKSLSKDFQETLKLLVACYYIPRLYCVDENKQLTKELNEIIIYYQDTFNNTDLIKYIVNEIKILNVNKDFELLKTEKLIQQIISMLEEIGVEKELYTCLVNRFVEAPSIEVNEISKVKELSVPPVQQKSEPQAQQGLKIAIISSDGEADSDALSPETNCINIFTSYRSKTVGMTGAIPKSAQKSTTISVENIVAEFLKKQEEELLKVENRSKSYKY